VSLAFREVSELQFEKPTSFPPLSTQHSAGTGYAQAPLGESMKRPWSESRLRNPDVWFDERIWKRSGLTAAAPDLDPAKS
jgi:hypothetical protein